MAIVEEAKSKIDQVRGTKGQPIKEKMAQVLEKNPGWELMKRVRDVLEGEGGDLPKGMGPADISQLKYCPGVSVDVERSFSVYKNVLAPQRLGFVPENLSKIMVTTCFYNRK